MHYLRRSLRAEHELFSQLSSFQLRTYANVWGEQLQKVIFGGASACLA